MSDTDKTTPKLRDVAGRITAHLKRAEAAQPKDGKALPGRLFNAFSRVAGSRVGVRYVSYQGETFLRKDDALHYLRWLDAGNVGKHYTAVGLNTRIREADANVR